MTDVLPHGWRVGAGYQFEVLFRGEASMRQMPIELDAANYALWASDRIGEALASPQKRSAASGGSPSGRQTRVAAESIGRGDPDVAAADPIAPAQPDPTTDSSAPVTLSGPAPPSTEKARPVRIPPGRQIHWNELGDVRGAISILCPALCLPLDRRLHGRALPPNPLARPSLCLPLTHLHHLEPLPPSYSLARPSCCLPPTRLHDLEPLPPTRRAASRI